MTVTATTAATTSESFITALPRRVASSIFFLVRSFRVGTLIDDTRGIEKFKWEIHWEIFKFLPPMSVPCRTLLFL